ncbi:MAG: helix-turn-helix domain-containing protein [Vulcanimicrobiaceae bacterium]
MAISKRVPSTVYGPDSVYALRLGHAIRDLRFNFRLRLSDLAAMSSLSVPGLSAIEHFRPPGLVAIEAVATALNLATASLTRQDLLEEPPPRHGTLSVFVRPLGEATCLSGALQDAIRQAVVDDLATAPVNLALCPPRRPDPAWKARVGDALWRARVARRASRDDLADALGINVRALVDIERGATSSSFATYDLLAEALAMTLDEITGYDLMPGSARYDILTAQGDYRVYWRRQYDDLNIAPKTTRKNIAPVTTASVFTRLATPKKIIIRRAPAHLEYCSCDPGTPRVIPSPQPPTRTKWQRA